MNNLVILSSLFEVVYGTNLELNALTQDKCGINFISRTAKNNGVSAKVAPLAGLSPIPAGMLTVAGGGSVLATFLQPQPFYSGRDLYYLIPKVDLTIQEKLFYCCCISANKYRYNYGRQANRTLREIKIPSRNSIQSWVNKFDLDGYEGIEKPSVEQSVDLPPFEAWMEFRLDELFDMKKGRRITKAKLRPGKVPFITAIDNNNGYREYFSGPALFAAKTITVNYNGNGVAEAFYQPEPYSASDDVNVLYPRFPLNAARAMFINTIIRKEKFRFNYGRKWHLERMKESVIKLPVNNSGQPNWKLIELYINSLPFTAKLS